MNDWEVVIASVLVCLPAMALLGVVFLPSWPSSREGARPPQLKQRLLYWLGATACVWVVALLHIGSGGGHLYVRAMGYVFVALGLVVFLSVIVAGYVLLAPRVVAGHDGQPIGPTLAGAALVVVLGIAVLLGMFVASMGPVRTASNWTDATVGMLCRTRIAAIWKGIVVYRTGGYSPPPPDLETLVDRGTIHKTDLQCPVGDPEREPHYFYFPPSAAVDAPVGVLVLCELEANHAGDKRHVLCNTKDQADIRALGPEAFAAELAKPVNAAFAAAFRAAGGKD